MTGMDFWYERAIRELADLNEEATMLRREAEERSFLAPAQRADDEDQ